MTQTSPVQAKPEGIPMPKEPDWDHIGRRFLLAINVEVERLDRFDNITGPVSQTEFEDAKATVERIRELHGVYAGLKSLRAGLAGILGHKPAPEPQAVVRVEPGEVIAEKNAIIYHAGGETHSTSRTARRRCKYCSPGAKK